MTSFKDTLYTVDKQGKRLWVYPTFAPGRIFNFRKIVVYILMAIYLAIPWIKISGEPAIWLDIPARRFVILGSTFWATDTIYVFLLLSTLAISLFFFTALLGRIWCGWACPETVFLEFLFRPIERLIEGNAAEQKRLNSEPWRFKKVFKKGLKLLIFSILAAIIANTAISYFVSMDRLLLMMSRSPFEHPVPFIIMSAIMCATLFQFVWFREQFCTVLCPYARFQSVMMDRDSITVGYDIKRGEPRGKGKEFKGGDCVDCGLCVRVCPTGIDIRNGLQLECISCAACIDACNSIMKKLARPLGLIRYASERELETGQRLKRGWLRPRVIIYSCILTVLISSFIYLTSSRVLSESELLRVAGEFPYTTTADGNIRNHFSLRISNKSKSVQHYSIKILDQEAITLLVPINPIPVQPQSIFEAPIFVTFPSSILVQGKKVIEIYVTNLDQGYNAKLLAPLQGPNISK